VVLCLALQATKSRKGATARGVTTSWRAEIVDVAPGVGGVVPKRYHATAKVSAGPMWIGAVSDFVLGGSRASALRENAPVWPLAIRRMLSDRRTLAYTGRRALSRLPKET
jgi:hypothetical protein